MEIRNAQIKKVSISMANHGCLTFELYLNCCAVGGYCIGHGYLDADDFSAESGSGLEAMMRIMDTVGVERWEDLKGKYIRYEDNGLGTTVTKIGNIIENKWFDIDKFFKEKQKDRQQLRGEP